MNDDLRHLATPATYRPEASAPRVEASATRLHPGRVTTLVLPYPPSANHYWRLMRAGRGPDARAMIVRTRDAVAYRTKVGELCAALEPLTGPVSVTVHVYRPRRTGDLDNCLKVLFDAMQGRVYGNDSQIEHVEAYRHDDKDRPRVEVEVRPLEVKQGRLL